jgi:hypothetical protein
MIEKRLVDLIPVIWRDIFASEKPDVEAIVTHPIKKLANRLRTALET